MRVPEIGQVDIRKSSITVQGKMETNLFSFASSKKAIEGKSARDTSPEAVDERLASLFPHVNLDKVNAIAARTAAVLNDPGFVTEEYDTPAKRAKENLARMPLDPEQFFALCGGRHPASYRKYLTLLSLRGTVRQALQIWKEMHVKGTGSDSSGLLCINSFHPFPPRLPVLCRVRRRADR